MGPALRCEVVDCDGCQILRPFVTGSGKTRLLEQAKILVINVRNDMLSVHIPSFIPELYPSYAHWKLEAVKKKY